MKTIGITVIVSALLLFGCSAPQPAQPATPPQPQADEATKAYNRANGLPENFVSNPELKDVMDAMVMEQADVLWSVTGPEDQPKDDDGWHKIDHAAIAMIETMRFLQKSDLTKDQMEWQNRTKALIDAANQARASIKEKNADKLFEAGGAIEEACASCHKIYYVEG